MTINRYCYNITKSWLFSKLSPRNINYKINYNYVRNLRLSQKKSNIQYKVDFLKYSNTYTKKLDYITIENFRNVHSNKLGQHILSDYNISTSLHSENINNLIRAYFVFSLTSFPFLLQHSNKVFLFLN